MKKNQRLLNEHKFGICKKIEELEEAFLDSCKYNETVPEDLEYFRRYLWNLITILHKQLEKLTNERRTNR